MELFYKKPSKVTQNIMSSVCKGFNDSDFHKIAEDKFCRLTNHDECKLVNSGNSAILLAMSNVKGSVIVPDQGAWHGFKQVCRFLNKDLIILKTDQGLVSTDYLDEIVDDLVDGSALFLTSFAAYTAEQDMKGISKYCHDHGILLVEDASGGIGDSENVLGNGEYSDVIVGSTGEPKIVNVCDGGFVTTSVPDFFKDSNLLLKTLKVSKVTASGMVSELDFASDILNETVGACDFLKTNLINVIHPDKRGINVIVACDNPKELSWKLRDSFDVEGRSIITKCPNYNRLKEKAVAIEIKNLDVSCLSVENLNGIVDIVNGFL
jgi:hypothetical protein